MFSDLCTAVDKCEFCYAFFVDPSKEAEHNRRCEFRLSRTFVSSDNKIKFTCTVCRDVFVTETELKSHENRHKYPGGYVCSVCGETFRNDAACGRHKAKIHQLYKCLWCDEGNTISTESDFVNHLETEHNGNGRHAMCTLCGAYFEQKSYLRLHAETNCGQSHAWNCSECGRECGSENAFSEHTRTSHAIIQIEDDCIKVEENPLILPKIEVSSIDYLTSEIENSLQSDDDPESQPVAGMEIAIGVVGNADAEMEWNLEKAIVVKPECESFDEDCSSDIGDEDAKLNEMDFASVTERWTRTIEGTFACNICNLEVDGMEEMESHVILHGSVNQIRARHRKREYKCRICLIEYRSAEELKEHGWEKHAKTTCTDCGTIFVKGVYMRSHISAKVCQKKDADAVDDGDIEGLEDASECSEKGEMDESANERTGDNADTDIIDAATNAMSNAQKMKIMKKKLKNWRTRGVCTTTAVCLICHSKYGYVWHFERHIKIHGSGGQLATKCSQCPQYFSSNVDLDRHMAKVHRHPCHLCDRTYLAKTGLEIHLASAHERYKCDKCGQTFNRQMSLKKHIRTACGTLPEHKCAICGNAFHTVNALREHNMEHEQQTNKVCSSCGKTFQKLLSLKMHVVQAHRRSLECRYCGNSFKSRHQLLKHLSLHTNILPFKCLACNEQFSSMRKLEDHRVGNTKCSSKPLTDDCIINIDADDADVQFNLKVSPNEYPCKFCGTVYGNIRARQAHMLSCASNPNRSVECDVCKLKFRGQRERKEHMEQFHKEFKCRYCDKKFKIAIFYARHMALHGPNGEQVHKCVCCTLHFATTEERTKHEHSEHSDKLKCKLCEKMCKDPNALNSHMKNKHENRNNQICEKCGKVFKSIRALAEHENSDCGKTPIYKCKYCGKFLYSIYTLQYHINAMHENTEKKFICSYCGKANNSKAGLQSHLRMHDGEKPYKCDYCDRRFTSRSSKLTHETTHTGIKPYMCQCGDRFSCISNLQSHRKARKTTCGLLPLNSKRFPEKIKAIIE